MNNVVELSLGEIEIVSGAGPVADGLQSVADTAAGVAAASKNAKVRVVATVVSVGAGILADAADSLGW